MSGSEPESAEAVLTENDKILAVGSLEAVQAVMGKRETSGHTYIKGLKGSSDAPCFY